MVEPFLSIPEAPARKPHWTLVAFGVWVLLGVIAVLTATGMLRLGWETTGVIWMAFLASGPLLVLSFFLMGLVAHRGNLRLAAASFLLGGGCVLIGFNGLSGGFSPLEVTERVSNPSGELEAVIGIQPTPATVPEVRVVRIVRRGGSKEGIEAFNADRVTRLSVKWIGGHDLRIEAESADYPVCRRSVRPDLFSAPVAVECHVRRPTRGP